MAGFRMQAEVIERVLTLVGHVARRGFRVARCVRERQSAG
jgi:hypothetical protein